MRRHKEVPVKVNALVDEGIADLVEALSAVPGLMTLESCQGGDGRDAFVVFRLGNWQEAGRFLFDQLLPAMSPDLRADVALRLRGYDEEMAQAEIYLDPCAIPFLVQCLTNLELAPVSPRTLVTLPAHGDAVAETVVASGCD